MNAKDDLLRMVWTNGLYDPLAMRTPDGTRVEVLEKGSYDARSGMMEHARVRIGDQIYVGSVAVGSDAVHRSAVLQVLSAPGYRLLSGSGAFIPQVVLALAEPLCKRYEALKGNARSCDCKYDLGAMEPAHRLDLFNSLVEERLNRKCAEIKAAYERNRDWLDALYFALFRTMGVPYNKESYTALYNAIPLRALFNERGRGIGIEALVLGTSGVLFNHEWDPHVNRLKDEFEHLRNKYKITPLREQVWNLTRSNPRGKVIIRLAQLSALIEKKDLLLNEVLACRTGGDLHRLFDVRASEYWDTHYSPDGRESTYSPKKVGPTWAEILGINLVVPMISIYGEMTHQGHYREQAIELLEAIPVEDNKIIRGWESEEITLKNAFDGQAILELHKEYCLKSRCAECRLGRRIMRREWENANNN